MKIGLFLPTFGAGHTPDYLTAFAQTAEAVGVASLWAPEHVVLVDEYRSRYPYSEDGRFPLDPSSGGLSDPFAVLTYLAGLTTRVRLGTGICLVPQRNPVYTAKQVACLDVLSKGRFDFGVGIGWYAEEFAAVGAEFAHRGARTRSYLEVMRRLWTEEQPWYEDEFYRLQGWFGWNVTPEVTAERVGALDRLLAKRGRKRADVSITVSPYTQPTQTLDAMKRYRDAGAEQVVLLVFEAGTTADVRPAIEKLGQAIIEPARRL
jgi:alkanesulfonate monooxygenase SsuD/methylene tetrahydromethanopterin reductase-like flavin-dependent oxidoreductase (luciferase family)